MHSNSEKSSLLLLSIIALVFSLFIGWDVFFDYESGSSPLHLVVELTLLCISLLAFLYSVYQLFAKSKQLKNLQNDLSKLHADKEKWRQKSKQYLQGLSKKIEQQFLDWNLTKSEVEVGFLLIKGLSQKEIAMLRGSNLKTVQHQCQSVYRKAKVHSRSELSAFFLEDLFPGQEL